ncbi:glycosyltransferase family 2 protein [Aestuariibius sp. 2305UL40-4]|uniref:glycosyltransferase family 2 protein n=1 Tax=Aestuariibius violaceus TaxID=3234132 RepID=UPI00345E0FD6
MTRNLRLSGLFKPNSPLQRKIKGAIFRATTRLPPPSADPKVIFTIPLVGRAKTDDWPTIQRLLTQTLSSLLRQTDPNWSALICCQDQPDLPDDPRIRHLPYTGPSRGSDRTKKIAMLFEEVGRTKGVDGYVFHLDADDILHPGLVDHIRTDNNGQGYVIETGYMFEETEPAIAHLGPEPPFWGICGSSNALRFDHRGRRDFTEVISRRGSHTETPTRMADYGFSLAPVPFPAALYLVNHGASISEQRGRTEIRQGYLGKHALSPDERDAILTEFGVKP